MSSSTLGRCNDKILSEAFLSEINFIVAFSRDQINLTL